MSMLQVLHREHRSSPPSRGTCRLRFNKGSQGLSYLEGQPSTCTIE
ncbi:hypothetical protein APTSU1_000051800 [Apodemus speciosus]|uniref:Uncharacterized protein n=1 Tax=Apodemus speciosus TaxID=105296 RepID=A0ABQ0EDR3_APOSI